MIGPYSLHRIATLQTAVRPLAESFLTACDAAGIPVEIIQGTRTFAQQQAIYDQGRTAPGSIVTQARPGDSYHQYGLAFDVVPVAYKSLPGWNPDGALWQKIGAIGKGLGLEWGGDWTNRDRPHFQLTAAPISELKAYWEKFKAVMPVAVTPTVGGGIIILAIAGVWLFFLRPKMQRSGLL